MIAGTIIQSFSFSLWHGSCVMSFQNINKTLAVGQILDNLNIEGLFTMLFKQPLTNIPDPGKHFLIVIDALDECQQLESTNLLI
jgi:hypothetical protein